MLIKNNLRKMREKRNIKQADMARAIKTTQSTYSMYETGRAFPSSEELTALCEIFDVKPWSVYEPQVLKVLYGVVCEKAEPIPKRRPFFSVKIPIELAEEIDKDMIPLGYANRTEYVVDTVRRRLVR